MSKPFVLHCVETGCGWNVSISPEDFASFRMGAEDHAAGHEPKKCTVSINLRYSGVVTCELFTSHAGIHRGRVPYGDGDQLTWQVEEK